MEHGITDERRFSNLSLALLGIHAQRIFDASLTDSNWHLFALFEHACAPGHRRSSKDRRRRRAARGNRRLVSEPTFANRPARTLAFPPIAQPGSDCPALSVTARFGPRGKHSAAN